MNHHEAFSEHPPTPYQLHPDVIGLRLLIVNVCFIGEPGSSDWVLVDAGIHFAGAPILHFAEKTFKGPPKAILLTHGHFDHVGTLAALLEKWSCDVYAHENELPYLTGQMDYPPGDPTVGGGLMAWISPLYPHKGIDLGERVHPLPKNGKVPFLKEWHWLHTPGHSPGHVSFYRESDQTLLAGDAFITVKQESALAVITQEKDLHGPPTYFTPNWLAAKTSVEKLRSLHASYALTGHGQPIEGQELEDGLERLCDNFDQLAVPDKQK